jgi:uncharacterized membrane protein YtjA (UPF0391 family)
LNIIGPEQRKALLHSAVASQIAWVLFLIGVVFLIVHLLTEIRRR